MNCLEAEEVIHGYLDGELDLLRSVELERHLEQCPECTGAQRERQQLRSVIQNANLQFEVPKGLERRVRTALGVEANRQATREQRNHWLWPWTWQGLAATGFAALMVSIAFLMGVHFSSDTRLADDVLAAHVRSLMVDHKTDIASSDQHTVKPWFDGKIDFAPPVIDLASRGFPLVGGRLDYVNGRPVAALVYQRRQHFVNVFIWPGHRGSNLKTAQSRNGYNLVHWNRAGMTFWAVSDLNSQELDQLSQLLE